MNIDLMAPRFKVIGPYPNSPYEAGGLVEITPSGTSYLESVTQEMSQWTNEIQRVDHYSHLDNIIAFPNLFQPIPWWEDRAIEDMPEFVKGKYGIFKRPQSYVGSDLKHFLPATEQEYTEYTASLAPSPSKTAGDDKYLNV